jgi:hypothetical protein
MIGTSGPGQPHDDKVGGDLSRLCRFVARVAWELYGNCSSVDDGGFGEYGLTLVESQPYMLLSTHLSTQTTEVPMEWVDPSKFNTSACIENIMQ